MSKAQARSSAKYYLERLEIAEYANRKLETLSKGNQQKIQLAQTLITDPDLVILMNRSADWIQSMPNC